VPVENLLGREDNGFTVISKSYLLLVSGKK
jgi:hypothetical protein